jgi:hypothetical protein
LGELCHREFVQQHVKSDVVTAIAGRGKMTGKVRNLETPPPATVGRTPSLVLNPV